MAVCVATTPSVVVLTRSDRRPIMKLAWRNGNSSVTDKRRTEEGGCTHRVGPARGGQGRMGCALRLASPPPPNPLPQGEGECLHSAFLVTGPCLDQKPYSFA